MEQILVILERIWLAGRPAGRPADRPASQPAGWGGLELRVGLCSGDPRQEGGVGGGFCAPSLSPQTPLSYLGEQHPNILTYVGMSKG